MAMFNSYVTVITRPGTFFHLPTFFQIDACFLNILFQRTLELELYLGVAERTFIHRGKLDAPRWSLENSCLNGPWILFRHV